MYLIHQNKTFNFTSFFKLFRRVSTSQVSYKIVVNFFMQFWINSKGIIGKGTGSGSSCSWRLGVLTNCSPRLDQKTNRTMPTGPFTYHGWRHC